MQTWKSHLCVAALFSVIALSAFADKRTENIDIILAIDKSLSMAENQKIVAVERYVNTWLMDEVLIPGDYLVVIAFYGVSDVVVSQVVKDETDKQKVKSIISQIRANGSFTDIGNALDVMKEQLAEYANDGRKKFVLMMTDGIQEAPTSSKYYSPQGKLNYKFTENTKTIQQQGWKIEILGLGTGTEVKELAQGLAGSYAEVPGTPTAEAMKAQTENLLGSVSLIDGVRISPVGTGGASRLSLTLKGEGLSKEASISITGIEARVSSRSVSNLIASPFTFTVAVSGTTPVSVPVRFPSDLPAGKSDCTLVFIFGPGERFSPFEVQSSLTVMSAVQSYWWIGAIGAVVLAAIVVLVVFFIRRLVTGKPVHFTLLVDGEPLSEQPTVLKAGGEIFLNETEGVFNTVARRNARAVARFSARQSSLGLEVLKADRFPKISGPTDNVVGRSFVLRAEDGKNRELRIVGAAAHVEHEAQEPKEEGKPARSAVRSVSAPAGKKPAKTTKQSPKKAGTGRSKGRP